MNKKIVVVLGIIVLGFVFASCKKECICMGMGGLPNTNAKTKDDCNAFANRYPEYKCEWK